MYLQEPQIEPPDMEYLSAYANHHVNGVSIAVIDKRS